MISLFQKNENQNIDNHYEKMIIKENDITDTKGKEKEKDKGIYLKKCEGMSKEEFILYLFLDKLDQLPIAQNILICSKETSIEEM